MYHLIVETYCAFAPFHNGNALYHGKQSLGTFASVGEVMQRCQATIFNDVWLNIPRPLPNQQVDQLLINLLIFRESTS